MRVTVRVRIPAHYLREVAIALFQEFSRTQHRFLTAVALKCSLPTFPGFGMRGRAALAPWLTATYTSATRLAALGQEQAFVLPKPLAWRTSLDVSKISNADQQAVRQAMQYWMEHWDQECPTLFGIELGELIRALDCWPLLSKKGEPGDGAAIAVLRELLYGASSLPRDAVHGVIGISFAQAEALIETLNGDQFFCTRMTASGR